MPSKVHSNRSSMRLLQGDHRKQPAVLNHPLPSKNSKRRPLSSRHQNESALKSERQSLSSSSSQSQSPPLPLSPPQSQSQSQPPSKKEKASSSSMKKFLSEKMKVLQSIPSMSMTCRKKESNESTDKDAASLDPLAAIIEEAKHVSCSKRVRLVRFDLDRNQTVDDNPPSKSTKTSSATRKTKDGNDAPRQSILLPSTITHANRDITDVKELLKKVIFDPNASTSTHTPTSPNLDTRHSKKGFTLTHKQPNATSTMRIQQIIQKGTKYQRHYNFPKAAKCFLAALKKLDQEPDAYPPDHPLREIANRSISDAHHSHRSLEHSANIVKIGLENEAKGHYVKALKMYTVAFRIRKDTFGDLHPSLPILLNLLGGVQVKRKQYEEAIQIYELALYGKLKSDTTTIVKTRNVSASTLAVSMKEIGNIHEHFGRLEDAMVMFHESLDCVLKDARRVQEKNQKRGHEPSPEAKKHLRSPSSVCSTVLSDESYDVCVVSASAKTDEVPEEMEIYLQESLSGQPHGGRSLMHLAFFYDSFFQITEMKSKKVDLHVATTLHSIASIHLKQQEFNLALSSYHASLRGMKLVHGEKHESVAAVLGNIGNLLKEMKDYDRAYDVYQSVLKIESQRLGNTHHNVLITKINIATIENCRRHYDAATALYKEVIALQKNKPQEYDKEPNILAIALSSLGDVYEKRGDYDMAIKTFKDFLATQAQAMEPFHPELGKILHKLGLLCSESGDLLRADSYFSKALRLYKKCEVNDERVVSVKRDKADNQSKLSLMNTPMKVGNGQNTL